MKAFSTRMDRVDLDHLESAVQSPGFALLERRQRQMLEALRTQLEAEKDDVRFVQGQLHALRRVMELPAILAREIQQKQKPQAD